MVHKKIIAFLAAVLVASGGISPVMAQDSAIGIETGEPESLHLIAETEFPVKVSDNYEDVLGYAKQDYNMTFCEKEAEEVTNIANQQEQVESYDICALIVSESNVILRKNGCFTFVDIVGELQTGGYVNLSDWAEYKVEDPSIATCSLGRIYGVNVGTTKVTAIYANYEVSFQVTIQEFMDYEAMMQEMIQGNGVEAYSFTVSEMNTIMNRANGIAHFKWKPAKQFRLNDGSDVEKDTPLEGLPYSQNERCTVEEFSYHLRYSEDFYDLHENKRYKQPSTYWATYGIDCSGFLCVSWNVSMENNTETYWNAIKNTKTERYEKVGTYSVKQQATSTGAVDQSELKEAYMLLMPGDAVVTRYERMNSNGTSVVTVGHARLVTGVNKKNKEVYMLEARNNFPEVICVSFDDLASEYYCPFAITSSYYNTK
ncbi:MAG: hypothetical protein K2N63_15230 [Lachnospiraceae bacterium]|nr:hypothetical protein [Lachnospiraceae bacterium]